MHVRTGGMSKLGPGAPLFGTHHARRRRCNSLANMLAELDAPASLWGGEGTVVLGRGSQFDGRRLLDPLNPWTLWPAPKQLTYVTHPLTRGVASADIDVAHV
jgi:hypothetical protein